VTVTKVVGFDLRIPKHFSLHFLIFLRFYMEFTSLLFLKTKEKGNELLHLGPWISVSSHGRSLAELDRTGEGRAAVFRRGSAPAARGKLGKRVRGLVRTFR